MENMQSKVSVKDNARNIVNEKLGKQGSSGGRGFASMDQDRQREIASRGGKAAHLSGNAHQFTSEEAREAGRKGGQSGNSNFNQRNIDKDLTSRRDNIDVNDDFEQDEDEITSNRRTDNSKY